MLNAGYIWDDILQIQNTGTDQGSLLTLFFFNVHIHDFDQLMGDLNEKHSKNNRLYENKAYGDPEAKKNYHWLMGKYSNRILKIHQ